MLNRVILNQNKMLTAILTNGKENILYFNHDERMWDLQIIPFGWTLIQLVKREWNL